VCYLAHAAVGTVLGEEAFVSPQNPVRLSEYLELQPDLAVLRIRDYTDSLPGAEGVLFLIEVSDTMLSYDRNVKLPLYARAGILEVWMVDLTNEAIERDNELSGDGYRRTERVRRGQVLESIALPALGVPVDSVLG
jgi:Uma2 family endonuclease